MFSGGERGLALSVFAAAPFAGPVIGPVVGGFIGQSALGWRWNFWIMASVSFALCRLSFSLT